MTMINDQSRMTRTRMSVGMHPVKPPVDIKFVKHVQDVIAKVMAGEIGKDKAMRMIVSDSYHQRINSCYVCHKAIETGEETKQKRLDPLTDQLITVEDNLDDSSHIPYRYRHAYHESYTNTELGYSEVEENRLRDAFRR